MSDHYSVVEENLRVVPAGNSSYSITRDGGTGFWSIEASAGALPVALRDRVYTSHRLAFTDIKNYLDGHAERSLIYRPKKKD